MSHRTRPFMRPTALGVSIAVVAVTMTGVGALSAEAFAHPAPFIGIAVPGASAPALSAAEPPSSSANAPISASALPSAGSYTVSTPAKASATLLASRAAGGGTPAVTNGDWSPLGSTGLSIAPAAPAAVAPTSATARAVTDSLTPSVQSVTATVLDQNTAAKHGLTGLVLKLVRADNAAGAAPVGVRIPNSVLAGLYGADFASRTRWVQLPDGATPGDQNAETAVAATPDTDHNAIILTPRISSTAVMLTPMSAPVSSSGTGSFSATSLKPASSWDVSAQTGDFSWSYPMTVPPAAAGPAPSIGLTYDSQSVDGETGSSNNQPSAVGDGWSIGGSGFIERTYVSCSQDNGASGAVATSGDLCWKTDNATLSLGGHTGQLVKDASTGVWKLQSDDGSRIDHLVGTGQGCAANGTYDTDCWRLTTRDGTQYFFGLNQLPGWASGKATTNSAWTVPVFGNDAGEPCHASTFAASSCNQAWRWNLDYVVDVHSNAEALYYAAETNKYAQNGSAATSYIRGGQLDHIDYGMTSATIYAANAASDKVAYGYDQYGRCSDSTHANCTTETITSPAVAAAHPTSYPDVPFDQFCNGATCPNLLSPTFWTTGMLNTVTTSALKSGAYTNVDVWTLGHSFPDPGDLTNAALWLTQVAHTGYDGATSLAEPTTTFAGTTMQNRVWVINGLAPLDKWRIASIQTSAGAVISVNYSAQQCTPSGAAAIEASPQTNTSRCFPQWWTPQVVPAAATTEDLFHKYVVTSVISNPKTGGGNDRPQETDYVYTGTPAWRYDTSPLTPDAQKTWSQYAGYNAVEIRNGNTATDYTFYQGMDGDRAAASGGTKTAKVTGSSTLADSRWFAGSAREVKVLNGVGGAAISDTVNTPWAGGVTANDNTNTARMTGQQESVLSQPVSTGGNRTTDTTTSYDSTYGLPVAVNTATSDAGSTCTTTSYTPANTAAWLVGLPDETAKIGTACANVAAAVYPAAAISDTRTVYDSLAWAVAPAKGDATTTQVVSSYAGSTAATAVWTQSGKAAYDTLGRATSTTDIMSHTTTTAYTPATATAGSGALTTVVTTNPLGWTNTETLDPSRGAETSATDQNGNLTTAVYDPLGHRTKVWLPNWSQSDNPGSPSIGYGYTLSQSSPNAVSTTTIKAGQNVEQFTLYDGLGRQIQTQAATYGGTLITDTAYDPAGRVYMTNNPYYETTTTMSASLFVGYSEQNIASEVLTNYDGAGRATSTVLNQNLTERYRTSVSYPGADRTDTIPPAGGTPTSTYTNTLGEKTKLVQYLAPTISGTTETTSYGYDVRGNMTSMTDPAANAWGWTFDVLGHQTQAVDPDTGTTNSTYTLAGYPLTTTDSRGITLAYSYDALNRKIAQYQNAADATGLELASWTYDTAAGGKGQLASSASYTGSTAGHPGLAYTDTITGYDGLSDPAGETISIPTGAPAFSGTTYSTNMYYYPDGALAEKDYPAAGGITDEALQYSYDSLGNLLGTWGLTSYGLTSYTALGQVSQYEKHGTTTAYTGYGYDPATGAIANIADDTVTGGIDAMQSQRVYSHDNAGNVTSDKTTGTASDTQCYTYDYLQNLTAVWTPTSASCAAAPTSTTVGGAAPFWKSYVVDPATGNRTAAVDHATSGTGADTAKAFTYPVAGAAHPHAVSKVSATTTGTTTNSVYGYDAGGDTTARPGQALTYTPTGKVATDTVGSSVLTDVYDASGTLLLQKDPASGATLYLGDTQIRVAAGAAAQSVVRTYSLNGTPVAERTSAAGSSTSALFWLGNDIDGTPDLETDATTGTSTHRYQDPYGNNRGAAVTWSSQNRYLDDPTSSLTGLTQVGARAYDPTIGKFLTVDSVLSPFQPQQNNGYDYSHNSPVTLADPTGLRPVGENDNDWQGNTDQNGGDNSADHVGAHGTNVNWANSDASGGSAAGRADPAPSAAGGSAGSKSKNGSSFRAVVQFRNAPVFASSPSLANNPAGDNQTDSQCEAEGLMVCSIYQQNAVDAFVATIFIQLGIVAAESTPDGPGTVGGLTGLEADVSVAADASGTSPLIEPARIADRSPAEIDAIARESGLLARGPDPMNGKGAYIDPITGEQRVLSHPNSSDGGHAHVNDPNGQRLDIDGNPVNADSPDAHLPIGK
ncbi:MULTISPECIES: RHS repeat protein [Subtercola]|nr:MULTISPECIES: RHS repeat-associated core domain-containing protein [Subtercola]MEA9984126.1 RHS repeat-associated core domain-containing protein [Subtercola sp. RTI3]